ncbi:NAD(P)/FAD-dependent oxidoreductase [Planomonospora venezuelensis]|uniref:Thioredoxin reductase n=1 Tax=Planomonospora venezuelensis TaxID=1999 RepID=A0A841CYH2_PLAVE|nr:NAD(P)/FAD-dependent oxidoreductase [Planomonospora venezuelensis]MBB5963432.1 thioredoxin reductase [Planomonospora venezuelensis]GIN05520.1 oxidase [Planomonospora venezuelensis]
MTPEYDLAVIGGGPAGVAGALTASLAGLAVVLVDAAPRLGGQYFRRLPAGFRAARPGALHHAPGGLDRFTRQCEGLAARADVLTGHRVWTAGREEADGTVTVRCLEGDREERPRTVTARRLLIATGAYDLPLPFPGWDLPGVLTAGGAQALLKGDLVVAGRRVVVAGTGPFLLPVAAGLAAAGAHVLGVHEAAGRFGLARHPLLAAGKAGEALGYGLRLARHRVPYRGRQAVIEAHGEHGLTHVTIADLDHDWRPLATRTVACDTLATGYGFVPRIDLAVQLGCALRGDHGGQGGHGSPVVAVDAGMRTSVPGVYAAGETTGVGGAVLAEAEGRLAGRSAAADLGRRVPPDPALSRRRDRLAAFARALRESYPVRPGWQEWLRDETPVCRCEEVPLAAVREARALGASDARSVKLLSRAGMGWCQGRMCGYAVSCLAGEADGPGGSPPAPRRTIAQPVRLGDLAGLAPDSPAGGSAPPASPSPEGPPR